MTRLLLDKNDDMLPLHEVARGGHSSWVQSILETNVVGVNTTTTDGYTALHLAASNGHLDTVVLLITAGAEVQTKNRSGETAFDLASGKGHERIASLLEWVSKFKRS